MPVLTQSTNNISIWTLWEKFCCHLYHTNEWQEPGKLRRQDEWFLHQCFPRRQVHRQDFCHPFGRPFPQPPRMTERQYILGDPPQFFGFSRIFWRSEEHTSELQSQS